MAKENLCESVKSVDDIPLGKIRGIRKNYNTNTFEFEDVKVGVDDMNRIPHFEGGIGEWE